MPANYKDIVEYHSRAGGGTMASFRDSFSSLLPREQVSFMQQMILFDHMIGRLISASSSFAFQHDYDSVIDTMLSGVTQVLKCQKARLYGVDFNSLGYPKGLWVVGGESGNLGRSVSLEEWAGYAAKAKAPVFSNCARDDDLWGNGYLEMERAEKKNFKWNK